jgi:hypothetical protein
MRSVTVFLSCAAMAVLTVGFGPRGPSIAVFPTITSVGKFAYVNKVANNYVGTPGLFRLADPDTTITGFYYAINNSTPDIYVPAGKNGTATLSITPDGPSTLTLYVAGVDGKGGEPGPVANFGIETTLPSGNIAALAWWKLSGHARAEADATGYGKTARLAGDAKPACAKSAASDGYRCALSVGGGGGQALAASSLLPIVGVNGDATVSAWVHVSRCASSCVALSQDAGKSGYAFALEYQRVCRAAHKSGACWKFVAAESISPSQVRTVASAPGSARLGKWTQLTAVYFAAHGVLQLYVDGKEQGSGTSYSVPSADWPGDVRIGNLAPGGKAHDWSGLISDVCLFYGVVAGSGIATLYRGDKAHPHDGCAALDAKYP